MRNEKYLNKVTSQHKTKPKFMTWLEENLKVIDGISDVLENMDLEFDIYKARGKQLDILGDIVGRSRSLDFQPADGSDPRLNDDLYRIVQLAKISINQWDGTIPGVVELWKNLFPEYQIIIQDNQDMTMNLSIIGLTSAFEKELMSRGYIAPKPEGVRLNYEFYAHLYKVDNSAFFYADASMYHHYHIDGKATVAKDTKVYVTESTGVSKNIIKHITINAKSAPKDINISSDLVVGAIPSVIKHISVDGAINPKDVKIDASQNFTSSINSSNHYIIN